VTLLQTPACGVAAARNLGARHSAGRWLAFLDDDDIWAPHRLKALLRAVSRAEARFAYSSVLMIKADLTPLFVIPAPPAAGLLRRLLDSNAIPAGSSNVVVDSILFNQVGGFDESLSVLADWDAWLRLAQAAPAAQVEDALTAYSVHAGNWILRSDPADESDYRRLSEKHAELIRHHGAAPSRLRYDRYIANSHLRAGHRWTAARRFIKVGLRERDPPTVARGVMALVVPRFIVELRRRRRALQRPGWLSAHEPMPISP
jgi:glycosyltransferase involved in cell wall biosynthesis